MTAEFIPGVAGQPMAPVATGRDGAMDVTYYTNGGVGVMQRSPITVKAANGDVLQFWEVRTRHEDYSALAIGMKRSTDNGSTYGEMSIVFQRSDYAFNSPANTYKWLSAGAGVVNANGRVLFLFTKQDGASGVSGATTTVWQTYSDDYGATWSTPAEITSYVKKVDNSTPANLPACYDGSDAAWGWFRFGPHLGTCDDSGRLVIPINKRYTTDQTGIGSCGCIINDDDGDATGWYLGGGFQESVSANNYSNELAIVLLPSGNYYANCRIVGGSNDDKRGQAIITDITATWPDMELMTTDGDTDYILSDDCAGSLLTDSVSGDIIWSGTGDGLIRGRLAIRRSTDGGVSFPEVATHWFGYGGYSHLWERAPGSYGVIFEATDDYANDGTTDSLASAQYIRQALFNLEWITDTPVQEADFQLNDGVSGDATYTTGTEIGVWSGYLGPGKGGTNCAWGDNGIVCDGSGNGIQLQEAQAGTLGGFLDPGLDDMTYAIDLDDLPSHGADIVLLDNRNKSATGKGVTIWSDSGDLYHGTICDGTNSCTVDQATPIVLTGGGNHRLYLIYERGVGATLKLCDAATLYTLDTTADNLTASTAIVGSQPWRLGSLANGNNPLPDTSAINRIRVSRAALADADLLKPNTPKQTPAALSGYQPRLNNILPDQTGLKLALFAPWFGKTNGYGSFDRFGGLAWPKRPAVRGAGVVSYRDQSSSNKLFRTRTDTPYRSPRWDTDDDYGDHIRFSSGGSLTTIGFFYRDAADSWLDFIQNTGVFTIMMAVNPISLAYSSPMVLMENKGSGSNPGINMYVDTNGTIKLQIYRSGGTARLNVSLTGALSYNTWYMLAFVGQGASAAVKHYRGTYSGGVLGALSTQDTTAMDSSDGTYTTTQPLSFGARGDDNYGGNFRFGSILVWNRSLTASEIEDTWAPLFNTQPLTTPSAVPHQGVSCGMGIGL